MTDDELLDRLDADLKAAIIACEKADARDERIVAAIRQAIEAMEAARGQGEEHDDGLFDLGGDQTCRVLKREFYEANKAIMKAGDIHDKLDAALAACRKALEE